MEILERHIKNIGSYGDIIFSVVIFCIISILLLPVPAPLMDFFLSFSVAFSIVTLVTVLFINRPTDFSVFPSVLLIATMVRLALNIASTRLILANGHLGTAAAGHIIEAFGDFVMQGSIVIGVIVFIIITIINFIVITKGSGRIAEVSARFSLDAMPGKQMAIDSDLSSGLIDEKVAKLRREKLEEESSFFGAMDGASKFIRGDAIAGIIVIFINLIGGILIGTLQRDMSFSDALHSYTILTIGDGLITQIPALLVSVASGLLVTNSSTLISTDKAIFEQLTNYPRALVISAVFLLVIGIMPGVPFLPFFVMSSVVTCIAYTIYYLKATKSNEEKLLENQEPQEESISASLHMDSICLEIGGSLLMLADKLSDSVKSLRKEIARDLGFILPLIRIKDNMISLSRNEYSIKIKNVVCAKGKVVSDKLMVMNPLDTSIDIDGEEAFESAFGLKVKWISPHLKDSALLKDYTVVEPEMAIITHLTEVIKENIKELVSYVSIQNLLDNAPMEQKKLINDIIPTKVSLSIVHRVIQQLLSEHISIRDLPLILESILEASQDSQNVVAITEHVRLMLSLQISSAFANEEGFIPVVILSNKWEQIFMNAILDEKLTLSATVIQEFVNSVVSYMDKILFKEENPVLLTSSTVRQHVKSVIGRLKNNIIVLAKNEIHPHFKIKDLGHV